MSELSAYEQMKADKLFKATIIEHAKFIYGEQYPSGHDWAVIFSYGFSSGRFSPTVEAHVVVYTVRESLGGRVVLLSSGNGGDQKTALNMLAKSLALKVHGHFPPE